MDFGSAPEWFDADWISKIKQDISHDNHRLKVCNVKPSVAGVHYKVTHSQLKAAGLFKCVWPFSGHQALKG